MSRAWIGQPPLACDICRRAIAAQFYDARTRSGPWAILCPTCFKQHGVGLGTGFGQHYRRPEPGAAYIMQGTN